MTPFTGYVFMKRLAESWRGLEFLGLSFGARWYVGFVRFDKKTDDARLATPIYTQPRKKGAR